MTASLHKLSAGDGYAYLTDQVARNDATHLSQRDALVDYYHAKGEKPGQWRGTGLAALGLRNGATVSEAQMKALYGEGIHPDADRMLVEAIKAGMSEKEALASIRLGRQFGDATEDHHMFVERVAQRFAAWNEEQNRPRGAAIPADVRAEIRSEVAHECFAEEFGRAPSDARELAGYIARASRPREQAVAGYDVTFSPAKSVSVLWALAGPEVARDVEAAHQAAIDSALAMMERDLTYTRRGAGGVRQVETRGLITAQFLHRDSRAGDPDLHTHVVISNKVQAVEDGAWLALDGGPIHQGLVAASEHYNALLRAELEQRLGVEFVLRERSNGRRGVWEIKGVPAPLCDQFSTRRQAIEARIKELAEQFQATHGRPASQRETLQLAQRATLETRDAKHEPRSEAEQREVWINETVATLGSREAIEAFVQDATGNGLRRREVDVVRLAQRVVEEVENRRAVWHEKQLHSAAMDVLQGHGLRPEEVEQMAAAVVGEAMAGEWSVPLQRVDPITEPEALTRSDGTSQYERAYSARFTSKTIVKAEAAVLAAAGRFDGRRCAPEEVEFALIESAANGRELNPGQTEMVRDLAGSGARVRLALAPAGSGKTTAMAVLSRAWKADGGSVVGLAPSASAAHELAEAVGWAETIDQLSGPLLDPEMPMPEWAERIDEGTLIVVDEAGMASTKKLAALVRFAEERGASVRLVGDDRQLSAVETGGVLRDLAVEHGSVGLEQLMRFSDPSEAAATLAARDGRHAAIGFYLDRGRVQLVDEALRADSAYDGWVADMAAGRQSLLLAGDREQVAQLNDRARSWNIDQGVVDPSAVVTLREGQIASTGDLVVTRQNNRKLRPTLTDFVKNGDRWTINSIGADGSLEVRHVNHERTVVLPADYVTEHVDLGYASTIHGAQGQTVDTTHTILDGSENRELFYVAVSRGRHSNKVYLGAADSDDHNRVYEPVVNPRTATDILTRILDTTGAQTSARTVWRDERDPATILGKSAGIWADAVIAAALHEIGPDKRRELREGAEDVHEGITSELGWDLLEGHLAALTLNGEDAIARLREAKAERPLAGVRDAAAVLDWRLDSTQQQGAGVGPLPWLRGVPEALREHPSWGPYFAARAEEIHAAAAQVWQRAHDMPAGDRPVWAADLASGAARGEVAVWRAGARIAEGDELAVGAPHRRAHEQRYQRSLAKRLGLDRAGRRWVDQVAEIEPRIVSVNADGEVTIGDAWWPVLAQRLDRADQAGVDVPAALAEAASAGPLPDDMPAAALWFRLAPHIGPTVATAEAAPRLHPRFATALLARLPEGLGERTMRSTQWEELVDVLTDAEDHHGIPAESLMDAAAQLAGIDRLGQVDGPNPNDVPTLLLARIHDLVEGPPTPEDPEPAPVFPDHDYSDGIPTPEPPRGVDSAAVTEGADEVEQQWLATQLDTDRAVDEQARQRIVELHLQAAQFYRGHYAGSPAANWISSRFGTDLADDPRIIIGYAPASWTALTDHLRQNGATLDELIEAGLTKMSRRGTPIDIFRDRVVVGLRDDQGDLVGFSGRLNPDVEDDPRVPKYLNTPTTLAFRKGEILYGYAENADRLLAGSTPVRVEGVFDAIAITHATDGAAVGLAPLGTALTHAQAEQIAAAAQDRPILHATDNDPAGRAAAIKDSDVFNHHGVDVRQLVLVDLDDPTQRVKDPAESLQRDGGRAIRAVTGIVEAAPTLTGEVVRDLVDRTKPETLRERVDVRALVTSQVAQVIAASPTKLWAEEIQHAAALIADRSMDHDTSWYLDQLEAETAEAAMSWESPAARSGDGLEELADRGVEEVRAERQRRISARLAATRGGDPARPARPVDGGAVRPSAQERLLRLRELLRDDHPAPPTQPGPPTPPAPEEPPRPGGPEREL